MACVVVTGLWLLTIGVTSHSFHLTSYIEVLMYADNRGFHNVFWQSLPLPLNSGF